MEDPFFSKYGPWALVTGASSGLGEEFARQLAQAQFNLVLVARRQERLQRLAGELEQKHAIQTRVVPTDLTQTHDIQQLFEQTQDLPIGLLINNAGVAHPGPFLEKDPNDLQQVIDLNITAVLQLTRYYGERMAQRGQGGIIFTSSLMAYFSSSYFSVYAGTKLFMLFLSQGLYYEFQVRGIDTLAITPSLIETEFPDTMKSQGVDVRAINAAPISAEHVVKNALKAVGRRINSMPEWTYKFYVFLSTCLVPRKITLWLTHRVIQRSMIKPSSID